MIGLANELFLSRSFPLPGFFLSLSGAKGEGSRQVRRRPAAATDGAWRCFGCGRQGESRREESCNLWRMMRAPDHWPPLDSLLKDAHLSVHSATDSVAYRANARRSTFPYILGVSSFEVARWQKVYYTTRMNSKFEILFCKPPQK